METGGPPRKEHPMKQLFNLENPFFQFLSRVSDLVMANFLFLLCCMPVVTMGAATAGLHKVTQDMVMEADKGVYRTFFRAFAGNFKQATISWLAVLFVLVGMGCNFLLVGAYFTGTLALVLHCLLAVILGLLLAVVSYLFPLMVRYDNTLRQHLTNAVVLAVAKLPRTIAMMLLNILPILIAVFSPQVFFSTSVFWLTVGFGCTSYLSSALLAPVFREMENPNPKTEN